MHRELYPDDWEVVAAAIKEAAGWRCQRCGRQCRVPGERFDTHRRTLTVHHRDGNPANMEPENLIALCAACHLRQDAKLHAEHARMTRDAKKGQERLL